MIEIEEIAAKVKKREYEFSKHAVDQTIIRAIAVSEVEQAILGNPTIIEDYPYDKYGPSCLVLGYTKGKRPLHIRCGCSSRPLVKIITLYQPSTELWIDNRVRKSR